MKKIVIIGPESTGKSTLCEDLARHFNTNWCPEYAREYLLKYGAKYTYDDLLLIARGQLALEEQHLATAKQSGAAYVFIDTDMYVMKVWCEFVFGKCHPFILEQIVNRQYDMYLLCNTDLPWTPDELREYPDIESRKTLFSIYKDIMINQTVPWTIISGTNSERLQVAIKAINKSQ